MYKLTKTDTIIRLSDNAHIPPEPSLPDWQMYQEWLAAGNTPEPVDAPTPIQQLQALDNEFTLTQRNLRETIMLMAEAFKEVSNNAVDLSKIPGVAKVYEVEAQAAELRKQL